MVNKPKIITILARLWLALGVIFTIILCFVIYLLLLILTGDPSSDPGLYGACLMWTFIFIILLLLFTVLSFVQWDSISKFKKWAVKRSLLLSFISLLIWLGPVIYFLNTVHFSASVSLWHIFPVSMCSILIVDIVILVVSLSPAVKEFLKTQ
ncbi:hypothetical protein AYK20_09600 [Thermoplasmatales archaeon SG8-52-1]|nr:MAG: hypothetical protein AYK20_09600 [Thermoplasmatales archaeon SG8-52-1]